MIVLTLVELVRTRSFSPRATLAACTLVIWFVLCGLTLMNTGAVNLRSISDALKAKLGALELAAAHAPPQYEPDPQRAPQLTAGPYFHTVHSIGSSPADTTKQILAGDPLARHSADQVLVALYAPYITAAAPTRPSPLAPAPAVVFLSGGSVVQRGPCLNVTPAANVAATVIVTLPGGAAQLRVLGGSARPSACGASAKRSCRSPKCPRTPRGSWRCRRTRRASLGSCSWRAPRRPRSAGCVGERRGRVAASRATDRLDAHASTVAAPRSAPTGFGGCRALCCSSSDPTITNGMKLTR